MNLARRVSQRTGLKYREANAILRAVAAEIADNLRENGCIQFEGLGLIFLYITPSKTSVRIKPTKGFEEKIHPKPEEREDEIIFE
jgi:nucleoid DNA-binding protein